jgi:hypothetical protein
MFSLIAFHVVIFGLAIAVMTRVIPTQSVSNSLGYLHKSIGITTPSPQQVRVVALIWFVSIMIIVDGCLFLTVFIASLAHSAR